MSNFASLTAGQQVILKGKEVTCCTYIEIMMKKFRIKKIFNQSMSSVCKRD